MEELSLSASFATFGWVPVNTVRNPFGDLRSSDKGAVLSASEHEALTVQQQQLQHSLHVKKLCQSIHPLKTRTHAHTK